MASHKISIISKILLLKNKNAINYKKFLVGDLETFSKLLLEKENKKKNWE